MSETILEGSISLIRSGVEVIFDFYFLWLPLFLWVIFWHYWKKYVVAEALLKEETTLLQIKLPREIDKSPKAMELFLNNLYQTGGEGNFYDKYWKGGTRPWFSLELVSISGDIKFYIWTRKKNAKLIETQLYSQYPTVEVIQDVEDYTKKVKYDPDKFEMFGSMFVLTKEDPYPIKTYIDYGLEDDPKEEYKIDPIASTMEFLGSIGSGEQVWIQILVRAHKKYEKKGFWEELQKKLKAPFESKENKNWQEEGKKIVDELMKRNEEFKEGDPKMKLFVQSKGEQKKIESVERSISKPGFDTAIRAIYLAEEDKFDKANIGGLLGSLKQYGSDALNGFKPASSKKDTENKDNPTKFDYPWQDPSGKRLAKRKANIFNNYIRRAHFNTRHNIGDFILNTEELATIYHFPGAVVETPTLPRIESKKAEPPTNLPQ